MKKVAVGSLNPVKIAAVKEAFEKVWPDEEWKVVGAEVGSGISDQPMSDEESIMEARNRATKSIKKLKAHFGVGLEGGLQQIGEHWFDTGWIVVIDHEGRIGMGSSVKAWTPKKMMDHVHKGMELGLVDDLIFKTKNSKHGLGHFGHITKNHVTRTSAYRDAVIIALASFMHPNLYE